MRIHQRVLHVAVVLLQHGREVVASEPLLLSRDLLRGGPGRDAVGVLVRPDLIAGVGRCAGHGLRDALRARGAGDRDVALSGSAAPVAALLLEERAQERVGHLVRRNPTGAVVVQQERPVDLQPRLLVHDLRPQRLPQADQVGGREELRVGLGPRHRLRRARVRHVGGDADRRVAVLLAELEVALLLRPAVQIRHVVDGVLDGAEGGRQLLALGDAEDRPVRHGGDPRLQLLRLVDPVLVQLVSSGAPEDPLVGAGQVLVEGPLA